MGAYAWVFDVTLLFFVLGVAYAVGSEGLYGAAIMFVNVLFGGLIAFSVYEPLAGAIARGMPFMATMADFVCLLIIFCVAFTLIRLATDMLGTMYVRFNGAVDQIGRYIFGIATAWYLVGMLVCMVQTAGVHKKFLGYQWESHAFWKMGIDRFWLGFVQVSTQKYFEWGRGRSFDSQSDFILRYHEFRPFGDVDQTLPGHRVKGAAPDATGQPGGAQGGQPGADAGGGRPPVDPTGATQQPGF